MDQKLSSAVQELEGIVCKMFSLPKPISAMRSIKLRKLKETTTRITEDELETARQFLTSRAPDKAAFDAQLNKLLLRGTRGCKELVVLLYTLAADDELRAIVKTRILSSLDASTTAQHRTAQAAVQAAAGAGAVAEADVIKRLEAAADTQAPSKPPKDAPASAWATCDNVTAGSLGVPTPAHVSNAGKASDALYTLQHSTHSARTTRSTVHEVTVAQFNPINPVYGQPEEVHSPAMRFREYTPSLTQDMTAARMARGLGQGSGAAGAGAEASSVDGVSPPLPMLPSPGNLFAVPSFHRTEAVLGQQFGDGHASSLLSELLAALPSWSTQRPHLTGADLLLSARRRGRALQLVAAGDQQDGDPALEEDVLPPLEGLGPAHDLLSGLPTGAQEVAVMHDLLYAFLGLDGQHVSAVMLGGADGRQPSAWQSASTSSAPGGSPSLTFMVRPGHTGLQPYSRELLERLTPLCEYVAVLQRFVETRSTYDCGMVSHALSAAVRLVLGDWYLVVTQLEHLLRTGRLTLQAMTFHCQAPMSSLALVAHLAAEAASSQLTSAGLLNLLARQAQARAGDQAGRTLLLRLLHAAAAPYFRMLERWLCEGVLDDPYGEFMVQEHQAVRKDALTVDGQLAWWSQRYTIRQCAATRMGLGAAGGPRSEDGAAPPAQAQVPDVPDFLQGLAGTILTTGKYLNAIRECGQAVARPVPAGTRLVFDTQQAGGYTAVVLAAHGTASSALLQLLLRQQDLLSWLRSLKHFFLLDQGDVVVHLAEVARDELAAPAKHISRPRLQSLLELAVRTSSLAQDPHADALQLELEPRGLADLARAAGLAQGASAGAGTGRGHDAPPGGARAGSATQGRSGDGGGGRGGALAEVQGWEVLLTTVKVGWPLALVVSPRALARYQLIFRHLFQMKHAERQLAAAWHRMQGARSAARSGRDALRTAHALAQRHLFLVQELLRYCTTDVLEPAWRALEERLRRAADVDEVIASHDHFLTAAVDGLLLSHPKLLHPLLALQQGALLFSSRVMAAWDAIDRQQQSAPLPRVSGPGSQRPPTPGKVRGSSAPGAAPEMGLTLAQRREARLEAWSQSGAPVAATAQLDVDTLAAEFSLRLAELLDGLQNLYSSIMRREGSATAPQSLETREEIEALLGLIQRLRLDSDSSAPLSTAGAERSTAALFKQLSAAAAAL